MLDRRKQFLVLSELVTEDSVGPGKEEQDRGCKPPVTVGLKTLFQKSGPGWEGNEKASFDDVQVFRIMSRVMLESMETPNVGPTSQPRSAALRAAFRDRSG
jgi:hypothetical protein